MSEGVRREHCQEEQKLLFSMMPFLPHISRQRDTSLMFTHTITRWVSLCLNAPSM